MLRRLILGVGEEARADDAAGLLAVRELRRLGIDAEEVRDLFLLPELLAGAEEAIIIDAVLCEAPAGELVVFDAHLHQSTVRFPVSTHGFGLGESIQLTEALHRLPKQCLIYGISAKCFYLGEPPMPEVVAGALRAARAIQQRVITDRGTPE